MANSYAMLYLALMCSFLTNIGSINRANGTKIVLQLIHRDSILPASLYRPNVTVSDHTNYAINSSSQAYLQSNSDDITSPLVPDEKGLFFLVNVSIGEPPIPLLLAMDTGSSLTWVQRRHCTGCTRPINDPKSSSTCATLSCYSRNQCLNYFYLSDCRKGSKCIYNISYVDKSWSTGSMAVDKFTFTTSTGGISELPDLVFGCGLDSHGNAAMLSHGILGLEVYNRYSLVSRVGNKFSYCIGNISDPYYAYNRLVLGEGAIIEGYTTPMMIKDGHYVVTLEGISVGEKQLQINQHEFEFNVVIDSGSTRTSLQRSAFEPLKKEVMKLLDGLLWRVAVVGRDDLCYRGNLVRDLKGFPTVTLHLAQGTDLSLDVEGMFRKETDDVFCMAVHSPPHQSNIIGITAQQYYNIGFDLDAMEVSFLSIECELLED